MVVVEGCVQLVRPMDAAAIDDQDHLFARFAKDPHDLMQRLAQRLGVKVGHDLIEDPRRAILDRPDDTEQDAAREAAPGTILQPGLAFAAFFVCDLALTQRACGQAIALGATPSPSPGERKAPQDCFIVVQ